MARRAGEFDAAEHDSACWRDLPIEGKHVMSAIPPSAFVRAEIRMKPTEAGGRRRPIASGYRTTFWLGAFTDSGERSYNDAVVHLEANDTLQPGETAAVRFQPAFPDLWSDVAEGSVIEVCEGSRTIGEALVLELFPY